MFFLSIASHLGNAHYQLVLLNTAGDIRGKNVMRTAYLSAYTPRESIINTSPRGPSDFCKHRKLIYSIRLGPVVGLGTGHVV